MMAHVLGSLSPVWDTRVEFWVPGFGLTQLLIVGEMVFGEQLTDLSLSLSGHVFLSSN